MSEFIFLHIGQAGVQIGRQLWERFMKEHGIRADGKPNKHGLRWNVDQLFDENEYGQFIQRAVFVDTEEMPIEELMKTDLGQLFDIDQLIYGKESAVFFPRGKYYNGKIISEWAISEILKLASKWVNLEVVIVFHSLSGGTGSGVFWELMDLLSVYFPKVKIISITNNAVSLLFIVSCRTI